MTVLENIKLHGGIVETAEKERFDMEMHVLKNFNFRPTRKGKKKLEADLSKFNKVKCRFENCTFKATDIKSIQDHLFTCELKPLQNITCKWCVIPFKTWEEVKEHVNVAHSGDMDQDETVNLDNTSNIESDSEEEDTYEEPVVKSRGGVLKNPMVISRFIYISIYISRFLYLLY